MSEIPSREDARGAARHDGGNPAGLNAADWLCLAATPSFAAMALLTGVSNDGQMQMMDHAAHGASPISGMALMYVLMGIFHASPWLKLMSRRRGASLSGGATGPAKP